MRKSLRTATSQPVLGWATVFGTVVAYDLWALSTDKETLSSFFRRSSRNKLGRILVHGSWLGLTWHLMFGEKKFLPPHVRDVYVKYHPAWIIVNNLRTRIVITDNPGTAGSSATITFEESKG